MTSDISNYAAIALQISAQSVEKCQSREDARIIMAQKLERLEKQILSAKIFVEQYNGSPVKLLVLPEYFLTSYPGRIGIREFAQIAALEENGSEYEKLGKIASKYQLFLAGNAYETDENFSGLYFQSCFIISPAGAVILRYRRLNSMFAPSPHDVLKKYLDIYGIAGLFPVVDTEIGKLAAVASEEILYPEIARAHALRGAEIFVHSSSEIGSPIKTHKMIAKQARAIENMAYVVSANTAGIDGTEGPQASADGNSMIVDFKGNILAQSNSGETYTAFADIDINSLRKARRKPGMTNYLSRQRNELFEIAYGAAKCQLANSLLNEDALIIPDRAHFVRVQQETIERLNKEGLI